MSMGTVIQPSSGSIIVAAAKVACNKSSAPRRGGGSKNPTNQMKMALPHAHLAGSSVHGSHPPSTQQRNSPQQTLLGMHCSRTATHPAVAHARCEGIGGWYRIPKASSKDSNMTPPSPRHVRLVLSVVRVRVINLRQFFSAGGGCRP